MRRAFWGTLIGGMSGGVVGLIAGVYVGFAFVTGGFEDFGKALWGAAVGAWLGALLTAYVALWMLKIDRRRSIVGWLAVLLPPVVGGAAWLGVSWTDSDDLAPNLLPYLIFTASVLASAFAACFLGLRSRPDAYTTTSN